MITLSEMQYIDISDEYINKLNDPQFNKGIAVRNSTKESCTEYLKMHIDNSNAIMYKVCHNKKMIGTIAIKDMNKEPNCCEFGIFLWEQGKGYGPQAINLVKKELKKAGITRMSLGVKVYNTHAIKCYKKSGFEEMAIIMVSDF